MVVNATNWKHGGGQLWLLLTNRRRRIGEADVSFSHISHLPLSSRPHFRFRACLILNPRFLQFQPWFWVTPPLIHPPPYHTRWQSRGPASYARKVRAERWQESVWLRGQGLLHWGAKEIRMKRTENVFTVFTSWGSLKKTVWNLIMFSSASETIRLFYSFQLR
jgi:hypothetical protein